MPPDSATATAVPTKGAEQGVARMVASMPAKKSPRYEVSFEPPALPASDCAARGTGMVTPSMRLSANSPSMAIITARNAGFWNWMPHPTVPPASRSVASPPARTRKLVTMPAAPARKRSRNTRRGAPTAVSTADSFSARTGRTQGIRFRISPPRKAIAMMRSDRDPAAALPTVLASASPLARTFISAISGGALTVRIRLRPASASPSGGTAAMNIPCRAPSFRCTGALKVT